MIRKSSFKKIRIGSYSFNKKKTKRNLPIKLILLVAFFVIFIPLIVFCFWFYNSVIKELPPIEKFNDINLSQTTVITDRNGEVLYKLFQENRKYVTLDKINKNMWNAIISVEDKNFWTNPGIDIVGIIRAGIFDITNPFSSQHGGSTLTQQVIKNFLLTKDKKLQRKFKEWVLAVQLNDFIKNKLKSKYSSLSNDELDRKVKEQILEIYLNHVPFGNNAYGIEAASQTYFGTSAQYLDIMQSAILAGIPQAPSKYSPYSKKEALMGKITITDSQGEDVAFTGAVKDLVISKISERLNNTSLIFDKETNAFLKNIRNIMTFDFESGDTKYQIKYENGRKDVVIGRMFEDGYVDQSQVRTMLLSGLNYKFNYSKFDIKAPHFVFRIVDELKEKYGEDILTKGGLTIKTSLDYSIQQMAEQSIKDNIKYLQSKGANNNSMIYLDSNNGDILAYVGSADYYDESIDGKVDVVQSLRQPGSTIKPFIYSLGMMKNTYTLDTPVYDIPFTIGNDRPNNVDGKFLGLMPIKKALPYSRNIPAIKMYFSAGQETPIKKFLKELGITSLSDDVNYGYPLAIGAGEVKMIEFANAYMHLSADGNPAVMNPVLEIKGSDGSILYQKQDKKQQNVIDPGVAYMIRKALSDKSNFPPSRIPVYSYKSFPVATKSGTTNIKLKSGKSLPRDGWFVGYTPSKVAMFWAGNTKGEAMHADSYGGWLNSPVWKEFFGKLEEKGYIKSETMPEKNIKQVAISKISGKLITNETPVDFIINTIASISSTPKESDDTVQKIEIDGSCNGKVSNSTPSKSIKEGYLIQPWSITQRDIEDVQYRWKNTGIEQYSQIIGKPLFLEAPTQTCEHSLEEQDAVDEQNPVKVIILTPENGGTVSKDFTLWFKVISLSEIKTMKILFNDSEITNFEYKKSNSAIAKNISLSKDASGENKLTLVAVNKDGGEISKSINISIGEDKDPPYLMRELLTKKQNEDGTYSVTAVFRDNQSLVKGGNIYKDGEIIKTFQGNIAQFTVDGLDGLTYDISDESGNSSKGDITLN